jgi:hypothetical protein
MLSAPNDDAHNGNSGSCTAILLRPHRVEVLEGENKHDSETSDDSCLTNYVDINN